jgi:beta-galactosidase
MTLSCTGTADADRAEDIDLIMEMGATFVRLAHYQHAETTYDLTDQNGLVIWTEIPLVNSASRTTHLLTTPSSS